MNALKSFEHMDIIGKRWFQKTYGNTYHSVVVRVDGEVLDSIPFTYGYDEMYKQSAFELLQKHGYYFGNVQGEQNNEYAKFIEDTREFRSKFTIVCSDVNRKTDL